MTDVCSKTNGAQYHHQEEVQGNAPLHDPVKGWGAREISNEPDSSMRV